MSEKKKRGCIGGFFKLAVLGFVALAALVVLLAVTLPFWISPVVTSVAGKVVPGYTGTDFRIDRFALNPYSGTLSISGVKLSNPQGFGDAAAFSMSGFNVEVETGSLFSDTIVVREITLDDAFVSYYSHDGKNNFDIIMENVEKATGPKEEKEKDEKADDDKPEKKIIIDRLRIAGTKVKLMKSDLMPALLLPTVELTEIGRKSNGATLEEAWKQISDAVMKSMAALGDGIGAPGGLLGDGAKDIGKVLDGGAKDIGKALDGGAKELSSALGNVTGKAGDSLKTVKDSGVGAVSGVVDVTKDVSSGAADAAKKTADVVGDAAKGTVDAVGDTTKKAAEGVKNLFKGFGK